MSFGAPLFLLLLLLVPPAAAVAAWWLAWRRRARARFGGVPGRDALAAWRVAALVAAIALAGVAAARPQAGSKTERLAEEGIDLVVVMDVSQSMLATDAQPSRLGRAQAEVSALLGRMRGDRVGLIIFAKQPFVRSPLTSDLDALRGLVEGVDEERRLVQPGSDLGAAIDGGLRLLSNGRAETQALLIVSDGEDRAGPVASAIARARAAGVRIYTAGAGTTAGAPVLDVDPETGEARPRAGPDGAPVITRLDPTALREMAAAGGGRYVGLSGEGAPLAGLASELEGLAGTTFRTEEQRTPVERFQAVAAIALLLVAVEALLPALLAGGEPRRRLLPLLGAGLFAGAVCTSGVADLNRQGNRLYARGDYEGAIERYRAAQGRDAARAEPYYNAGNAFHRKGEFDTAVDESRRALQADATVAALAEYATGNHLAVSGRLLEAVEAYRRALLADPADADAKHNLELLTQRLSATPTASPTPRPEETPGGPDTGGEPAGDGTPTAAPGEGTPMPAPGTPGPGDPSELSEQELQRALEEALRGIDEEFSIEEALRVLELLKEQNRRAGEEPGAGTQPDY